MKERRCLFENKLEYQNFLKMLDSKIEDIEKNSNPNFLIIPSYACNLSCTYCYEQTYNIQHSTIVGREKNIDKQFDVINNMVKNISQNREQFVNKDIKITIMGGEPLMVANKMIINYIFKKIEINRYRANIITNGIDITGFLTYIYRYICGTCCPAAKHKGGTHLDINKPNCIDYENLINSLILEYINKTDGK